MLLDNKVKSEDILNLKNWDLINITAREKLVKNDDGRRIRRYVNNW